MAQQLTDTTDALTRGELKFAIVKTFNANVEPAEDSLNVNGKPYYGDGSRDMTGTVRLMDGTILSFAYIDGRFPIREGNFIHWDEEGYRPGSGGPDMSWPFESEVLLLFDISNARLLIIVADAPITLFLVLYLAVCEQNLFVDRKVQLLIFFWRNSMRDEQYSTQSDSIDHAATAPAPTLLVIGAASMARYPQDAVPSNTLVVAKLCGEDTTRIYWRGKRLNGHVASAGAERKSNSNPQFTMIIDGESVVFGNDDVEDRTFMFRDEKLNMLPAGVRINYDAVADRPNF